MLHDLEGQQEQLTREVDRIHTELESANAQKASVVSKLQELERSHKTTMDGLSKKTKELEDQERDLNMEITASNEKLVWLKQSSEEADKEYTKWSAQVRHGRQEAKKMDHELLKVLTTIGQLEEEVQRMHEEIRTTVETNQNLITTYKAQLEKMQVQLGSEQKQRVEAQRKKRQLTRQMDVFREAHVKFLRNVQRNIARLKNTGSKTESEMKRLNEEIESSQRCTNETVFHMEELKEEIEKESQKLLDRIGNARKQVAEVEDEVKQTKDHIDEEEPGYETVKQVLAKRTEFYGRLREQQTQLTLELKTLGQQVTRKTAANSTLSSKVLEARNRLSTRMSNNKTQLVSESNLLSDLEKQIYMNGCRLKTVLIENARLFWGIQDQENEMRQVCSHWERLLRSKSMVQSEVNNAYGIVKHCQDKEENEMKTTLAVWKENNMQCEQMKSLTGPVRKALAEALDILL
ncbi:hypothetical protein D915_002988 [Fasciola hepatica]|uniref:Uncharacterized protein n=1 Tax=Fasciola hepatica TaxID=6192 RepID=A0A4E0S2K7_FASHE|nr:hypothetical protein D915_002988 [Fasciola hepatica]